MDLRSLRLRIQAHEAGVVDGAGHIMGSMGKWLLLS